MTEATGFEAKTIHRLLEVDPKGGGFKRDADNPLLASAPLVQPRRTWNVAVTGTPYYRYKVVALPGGDCRDLRGYGDVQATIASPVIDDRLPTSLIPFIKDILCLIHTMLRSIHDGLKSVVEAAEQVIGKLR